MGLWLPVGSVLLTVILGVIYQTHHFDKRMDDLKEHFDQRVTDLEKRLVDRLERVEHPVHRP